ncbi:MAG TPA: HD domain-containing protein [Clostridiales bacterium]|nr:HD domain-containing protein [Clostridiales bacterium]
MATNQTNKKSQKNKLIKMGRLLRSPQYKEYMDQISRCEETRRFCRHDRNHCWETARTAYILYLTGEVPCGELESFSPEAAKEMIYAAAFLHDIGRFKEYADEALDHSVEGAVLARPLLFEAGFSDAESRLILKAIAHHRKKDGAGFDLLLYRADKESRPCYDCPVLAECKKFSPEKQPVITV